MFMDMLWIQGPESAVLACADTVETQPMFPPGSEEDDQLVKAKIDEVVETEGKHVHEDPVFPISSLYI